MSRAVVVIVEHGKRLALAREPGGLAVREALSGLGKGETYFAQTLDQRRIARGDGLDWVRLGLRCRWYCAWGALLRRRLRRGRIDGACLAADRLLTTRRYSTSRASALSSEP